jgi:hypothetical protein
MRNLFLFLYITIVLGTVHAEILIEEEGKIRNLEQGVPMIVYSTTFSKEQGTAKQIESQVLSVLTDGQVYLIYTLDNQRNRELPPEERKITIRRFGPVILPEKIRAALQRFFLESGNWTLAAKSYVPRNEKGVWLAELTLQYGTAEHHCCFSSIESKEKPLSTPAGKFLLLLEHIMQTVLNNKGF